MMCFRGDFRETQIIVLTAFTKKYNNGLPSSTYVKISVAHLPDLITKGMYLDSGRNIQRNWG
jgi:hypothetical protein